MPDDTPQVDWQNDPDFKGLPLAEKHKVLLQIDADYKGLPSKEQMKVLDQVHYGPPTKSDYKFTMGPTVPRPPGGGEEAMLAKGAPPAVTAMTTAALPGAAIRNPIAVATGLAGSATGAHYGGKYFGEPGEIVGGLVGGLAGGFTGTRELIDPETEEVKPWAKAILGKDRSEMLAKWLTRKKPVFPGATEPSTEKFYEERAKQLERHAQRVKEVEDARQKELAEWGKLKDFEVKEAEASGAPKGESEASILKERHKRMAAYAEMERDKARQAAKQSRELERRVTEAEKARQQEITDWAKLDRVTEEDHAAFEKRLKQIEGERQKALADQERFKQQHAAALNARKGARPPAAPPPPSPFAGMTSTATPIGSATLPPAPQGAAAPPPRVLPPPPETPAPPIGERPTIGSEVAKRSKGGEEGSILSRGRELYRPGEEPDMNNPVHVKIINQLQTRSGAELRTMAKNGDRFAAFVLRNMPRP